MMNQQPDHPLEDGQQSARQPEDASPVDEGAVAEPEQPRTAEETGAPPQVVAETPVGGLRPTAPTFARPLDDARLSEGDSTVEGQTGASAPAESVPTDETLRLTLGEEPSEEAGETEAGAQAGAEESPGAEAESLTPTGEAALPEEAGQPAPTATAEAALVAEVPAEETPVSLFNAALAAVAEEAPTAQAAESAPAEAGAEERLTSPQEWEEDLSPELAAVLFGSPRQAAVPARAATVLPAETPAPSAAAPVAAPAEPVSLTSEEGAMTLPLSAAGQRAPAPALALRGKARYTRVEEPLPGDGGQHIVETWVYFKPELPALEGRLVQRVTREEWRYSDGSWHWRYERRYADRGRDSRDVRANAARTYFERADNVSVRDAESGRRQQFSEEAALIFAAPVREEKRGFLRNLFRRGDNHEPGGEKAWRPATPAEIRQARKSGEQGLRRRGLFG
jgi:hypothetical protein